jgi:hypothetical protein
LGGEEEGMGGGSDGGVGGGGEERCVEFDGPDEGWEGGQGKEGEEGLRDTRRVRFLLYLPFPLSLTRSPSALRRHRSTLPSFALRRQKSSHQVISPPCPCRSHLESLEPLVDPALRKSDFALEMSNRRHSPFRSLLLPLSYSSCLLTIRRRQPWSRL